MRATHHTLVKHLMLPPLPPPPLFLAKRSKHFSVSTTKEKPFGFPLNNEQVGGKIKGGVDASLQSIPSYNQERLFRKIPWDPITQKQNLTLTEVFLPEESLPGSDTLAPTGGFCKSTTCITGTSFKNIRFSVLLFFSLHWTLTSLLLEHYINQLLNWNKLLAMFHLLCSNMLKTAWMKWEIVTQVLYFQ